MELTTEEEKIVYPYGKCECTCGTCDTEPGPAAYMVTRNSREMIVCTRCRKSMDQNPVLLVNKTDSCEVFIHYDQLGFMMMVSDLAVKNAKKEN